MTTDETAGGPTMSTPNDKLLRTPVTWAIYGSIGAWAGFIYLTGPISPVLAEDLGVAAASAGLVGTALAVGSITAAAMGQALIRRFGRDGAMRLGLATAALAMAGLATLPQLLEGWAGFALVLALVWLASIGGTLTLNVGTARLSALHAEHSGAAITEANAAAAWVGVLSPLVLGAALGAGLGWWVGYLVALVMALAAMGFLALTGRARPEAPPPDSRAHRTMSVVDESYEAPESVGPAADGTSGAPGLPRIFRVAMVALFAAVGTEFAINFLGSTLIQDHTGASTSEATGALAASILGVAVGRTLGTRVTDRLGPHRTLITGFALTLVGFTILWTAQALVVAIAGLFIGGLGLATLFPLIIDRGIGLSGGHPDLAMSRASYITGMATGGAPFALGALGGIVSVPTAMLLVPLLIIMGLLGVIASRPALH